MKSINKTEAAEMVLNSKGKFLSVVVKTRTNNDRKMCVRYNANNKADNELKSMGMLKVYDSTVKGIRTLNLQNLKSLKFQQQQFKVK